MAAPDNDADVFNDGVLGARFRLFVAARTARSLSVEELLEFAAVSYLLGHADEAFAAWEEAHACSHEAGDVPRAVRCAFWLSFGLSNEGRIAPAGGWVDRARRLLEDADVECVEQGYVEHQAGLRAALSGDVGGGHAAFDRAAKIARRHGDNELAVLATVGKGRCLIYLGELAEGVTLLDEAMVAVAGTAMSPVAAGDTYCTVIEACHELFDVERAREWTAALVRWCDERPGLVLYRRQCFVHRAELMLLDGRWDDAERELHAACDSVGDVGTPVLGLAWYLRAQLHRLRGEHDDAERAYRHAHQMGHGPQPGMAQLHLARGDVSAAARSMTTALDAAADPLGRAALLGPAVHIALAAGDASTARARTEELGAIAADVRSPYLRAVVATAEAAVLRAGQDDVKAALRAARTAWSAWHDLDAPYEAARARVLIGEACAALGDETTEALELDAARAVFRALGARDELARLGAAATSATMPLSAREVEVLVRVAQGRSNREIASELIVSEKTVASHVSHILTKLGLPNRAAATAYAYQHGLARPADQ